MIGCHGMKVPPGKVVAPTYNATMAGRTQTPNQPASLNQRPSRAAVGYLSAGRAEASVDLVDVLDIRVSSVDFG
jgi:hypothetical protein